MEAVEGQDLGQGKRSRWGGGQSLPGLGYGSVLLCQQKPEFPKWGCDCRTTLHTYLVNGLNAGELNTWHCKYPGQFLFLLQLD